MGLISNLVLILTDLSDFFRFCRSVFDALPLAVRMLIYFVFGAVLLFGLMRMVLRVGSVHLCHWLGRYGGFHHCR